MKKFKSNVDKILDSKVTRKQFLAALGLGTLSIPLLSPSVAAQFFIRQTNGNLINIDDLGAGSSPGGPSGSVQYNQSGSLSGTNNLHWDSSNNRLGIGTNSPDETLHVVGNTEVDGDLGVTGDAGVIGYVRADNGFQVDGTTIIDDSRNIINAGTATFSGTVTAATPSANEHLATKAYVDNTVSGAEFDKGGLVEGDGVSLSGTLTNRLIGQGTLSISTLPASDTQPGHVTTGTQTFAGTKTFNTTPLNISANNQTLNFSSTTGTKTITTGGSTHLNINPGGNVGIGTTDPSEKLEVNGNINVIGTSAYLYAGYNAIRLATKGDTSVSFSSTIIGKRAGDSTVDGSTERQTALGYEAGSNNSGERQTALGHQAGKNNTGEHQTTLGYLAGYQNTGERQTALGYLAGRSNTGERQTALGYLAGRSNSGTRQTALGYLAGRSNTGEHQTTLGYLAGYQNTGEHQTALGYEAGSNNSGEHQTALGHQAGRSNTGEHQTTLGYLAGYQNTGEHQTTLGYEAGRSNSGERQTALGYQAGNQNTGIRSTNVGYRSGLNNTGARLLGLGYEAGGENSGDDVVAIGYQAGKNNTTNNQFIVQQTNINATPLIQGNFSTGNVGIGTTSPSEKLDVNGKIRMRTETTGSDADDIVATKGYVDTTASGAATWGSITGDLSDQTDLQSELDDKADDDEVVKLTGAQTIAGVKTFSSTITGSISGNAGTATNANRLVVPDTRGANDQPQAKAGKRITADFKFNTAVGSPPVTASGTFSHIITVAGWNTNEASGGWPTQLSIGAAGIAYRQATSATAWGGWNATVNTSGNQSISGTKTHTGIIRLNASGIYLRQDSTSSFGDSAGSGWGKIQYHSNRWYINAGSNSTEIIQFRRGSSNVGNISNSGDLTMSGNITAYSDIKLKENIQEIPQALNKILSLRGVTYNRKDVQGKPKQTGVIAQEIEQVLPEAIETSKNEKGEITKSVAYGNLAGIFIEAIKELKKETSKEIKKLQQKINNLEKNKE